MTSYQTLISHLQSNLSRRAWNIQREDAFKGFYKAKGRSQEAKASKATLKVLHSEQGAEKAMLKVLQELDGYAQAFENDRQFMQSVEF